MKRADSDLGRRPGNSSEANPSSIPSRISRTPRTPRSPMAYSAEMLSKHKRIPSTGAPKSSMIQSSSPRFLSMLPGMGPTRKVAPLDVEDDADSTASKDCSESSSSTPASKFSVSVPQSRIGVPLHFAIPTGGKVVPSRVRRQGASSESGSLEAIAAKIALQVAQNVEEGKGTSVPSAPPLAEEEVREEEDYRGEGAVEGAVPGEPPAEQQHSQTDSSGEGEAAEEEGAEESFHEPDPGISPPDLPRGFSTTSEADEVAEGVVDPQSVHTVAPAFHFQPRHGSSARDVLSDRRARSTPSAVDRRLQEALAVCQLDLEAAKRDLSDTNRELAEAHKIVAMAGLDWAREKQAREKVREACKELTRDLEATREELDEMRESLMESEKALEDARLERDKLKSEVEEERDDLALAENWREHNLHVKLMEAQAVFDGKLELLEGLQMELEEGLSSASSPTGDGTLRWIVGYIGSPESKADFSINPATLEVGGGALAAAMTRGGLSPGEGVSVSGGMLKKRGGRQGVGAGVGSGGRGEASGSGGGGSGLAGSERRTDLLPPRIARPKVKVGKMGGPLPKGKGEKLGPDHRRVRQNDSLDDVDLAAMGGGFVGSQPPGFLTMDVPASRKVMSQLSMDEGDFEMMESANEAEEVAQEGGWCAWCADCWGMKRQYAQR